MFVNLEEINSNIKEELLLEEDVHIEDTFLVDTSIKKLENVKISASIYRNSSDETILKGVLSGNMHLDDSISLEDIVYPFSIELEESLENSSNTIDILPILWQNIVLEVPLRYTNVSDLSSYSGDGWKLISEEEAKSNNNPFLELKEKFKEE